MLGRRILVPLDGSPFGRRALPLASRIAKETGGTLHLVTVQAPWPLVDVTPPAGSMMAEAGRVVAEDLQVHLAETAEGITAGGLDVRTDVRMGIIDDEILAACKEADCDLIAMSTHGRGGFERVWLGSVADRVSRHARVPVLLVPGRGGEEASEDRSEASTAGATAPDAGDAGFRTVVIPLDGSPFSRQALVPATALGELFEAEYILFRAVPPRLLVGSPYMAHAVHVEKQLLEAERGAAKHALDVVAVGLRETGYRTTVALAEQTEPVPALLRLAHEENALIAMTTHGRGGLRRAVLGSTADKVIRGSRRPILLIRPEERDDD